MGGFYELSPEEADALNANDGCEPLTFEKYKPHRKQGDEGATFRLYWDSQVSACPPGHEPTQQQLGEQDATKYAVYDAHALWNWLKTHERDPTNSFWVDREDWMLLREAFDATMAIPDFVQKLPHHSWPDFGPNTTWVRKAATTDVADGTMRPAHCWSAYVDGSERFRTFTSMHKQSKSASDGFYMEGPKGAERIVRVERNGTTTHCTGPSRQERCYQIDRRDGGSTFYDIDEGVRTRRAKSEPRAFWSKEKFGRLYKSTNREGTVSKYFEGPKGHERLTKLEGADPSGTFVRIHYTGKRGKERVTRVIRRQSRSQGDLTDTLYKKGPKGRERVWKRVIQNMWSIYYEGEKHNEAVRKIVKHEGFGAGPAVMLCDGPRLGEWMVKLEVCDQQGDHRTVSPTARLGRLAMVGAAWAANSVVIQPPVQV